ncbi:MAG: hypothetical protein QW587_10020 [Candidatus Bathyarchaeia archaeon]
MVSLTVEGTTVTVAETQPVVKSKAVRYAQRFIPDGSKLYVKKLGVEGLRIQVRGLLQGSGYLADKAQLQTWHASEATVTYTDDVETTGVTCRITELSWELVPGWEGLIRVALTLVEV